MAYFVVTRAPGPSWDVRRGVREQRDWDEHAAFLERLADEGFIVLGGPLGESGLVMLVVEATEPEDVRSRLSADPWERSGEFVTTTVQAWSVWLDGRPGGQAAGDRTRRRRPS